MSECVEATTMSRLGPVTCSAFTVIDPAFPPDELVCSLMMTVIPPGSEIDPRPDALLRCYSHWVRRRMHPRQIGH